MLGLILRTIRSYGFVGLARAVMRRALGLKARSYEACQSLVAGRSGLEIGGPSAIFRRGHLLPLYPLVVSLDNCNFAASTVWAKHGRSFVFDRRRPAGTQLIREATDLQGIGDGAYQFVLSSHTIEHVANPLLALREWRRVLVQGGALVLVAPHRENHLDRQRDVTTFDHLRADLASGVREDDPTHLSDGVRNTNRTVHHHVFSTRLAAQMVEHAGFRLVAVEAMRPHHILILATKAEPAPGSSIEAALGRSPFRSDRVTASAGSRPHASSSDEPR